MVSSAASSIYAELTAVDRAERSYDAAQGNVHRLIYKLMKPLVFHPVRAQALIYQLKLDISLNELFCNADACVMNAGKMACAMHTLVELHNRQDCKMSASNGHTGISTTRSLNEQTRMGSWAQQASDTYTAPSSIDTSTSSCDSSQSRHLPAPVKAPVAYNKTRARRMRELGPLIGRLICPRLVSVVGSPEHQLVSSSSDLPPFTTTLNEANAFSAEKEMLSHGLALLKNKKWPEAVLTLEWLVDNHPDNAQYASLYRKCLDAIGQVDKSVKVDRAALEVFGDNSNRLRSVIATLMRLNRGDEANAYRARLEGLESGSRHAEIETVAGGEQGDVLATHHALYNAVLQSRKCLSQGDKTLSLAELQSRHAQHLYTYGIHLSQEKRHAEALGYLKQAVSYDPFNSTYLDRLKQTEQSLGAEPSAMPTHTANQRFDETLFRWDR